MKSTQKVFLVCFICFSVLFMTACGKDDNGPTGNSGTSKISMKINGELWEGSSNFVSGITSGNFTASCKKDINGKSESITMTFLNINTSGDNIYDNKTEGAMLFVSQIDSDKSWGMGSGSNNATGTLRITKTKAANFITQASATFSGVTKDGKGNEIVVTDGKVTNSLAE